MVIFLSFLFVSSCISTIMGNQNICSSNMTKKVYETDGPEAKEIAQYLPYFPFKGIPRFYDIGGFLANPEIFQKIVDIFVSRYDDIGIEICSYKLGSICFYLILPSRLSLTTTIKTVQRLSDNDNYQRMAIFTLCACMLQNLVFNVQSRISRVKSP